MKSFIEDLRKKEQDEEVKEGLVIYHRFPQQKVIVLGRYDGSTFDGTDRMSKGVGPKFREWLSANKEDLEGWTILGEGERFSNQPNLDAMFENADMELVCVSVGEEELNKRHAKRGEEQNESWRKGMSTRISNLCKKYDHTLLIND